MTAGYDAFEFDLPDALLAQLVDFFANLDPAPLTLANASQVPKEPGVYQLFFGEEGESHLVYVGKTVAAAGLRGRLEKHARKIQHRTNLDADKVLFKAVRVYVFAAVDLEKQLIDHYRTQGHSPLAWNNSGFGANDPGENRDTTEYREAHYDALYPIDTRRVLAFELPTRGTAADVLRALKEGLHYLVRFERAPSSGPLNRAGFAGGSLS